MSCILLNGVSLSECPQSYFRRFLTELSRRSIIIDGYQSYIVPLQFHVPNVSKYRFAISF